MNVHGRQRLTHWQVPQSSRLTLTPRGLPRTATRQPRDDQSDSSGCQCGKERIGPSFGTDDSLSPDDEQSIYDYYGMQRSTQSSPTGYAGSGAGTTHGTQGQTDLPTPPNEVNLTAADEE